MMSIRPVWPWFLVLLMLTLISGCDRATAAPASKDLPRTASTFTGAKQALYGQVYFDHRVTFYCGCDYSADRKIDLASCGLTALAGKPRAQRIEAEHIFPAAQFGNFRACWRKPGDFPECAKSSGRTLSGRECCQRVDPVFEAAHNDLMNLVPSVGEVNGKRSNYNWGMIPGEKRAFGTCNIEVDSSTRRAEPPETVMGDIARIMFYMEDTYGFRLSNQDRQLYNAWSRMDPPDAWEMERNRRIAAIQGRGNRFVAAVAPAKPLPASDTPAAATTNEFTCSDKRRCSEISSCAEAKFYLSQCGVRTLDGDGDGTPCEKLCRGR